MFYPHLCETTMSYDSQRTFALGIGMTEKDLTDEEKDVLEASNQYVKEFEIERDRKLLKDARNDFEKLRDIEGMPEEALHILKEWTFRDGDDEYGE